MTPLLFHVPPRGVGASHTSNGVPPSDETVLSLPPLKKPSVRLSGDEKGSVAPSVPAITRLYQAFSFLTQSRGAPFSGDATNAKVVASGEITMGPAKSPVNKGEVFSSGTMTA